MTVVVIDDQLEDVLPTIEKYISLCPFTIDLVGSANDIERGFNLIINAKPDLVFLDVQIGTDSGFDLLGKFKEIDFIVVFISGYDKYAINAIRAGALDFLQKPIAFDEFEAAITRAINLLEKKLNINKQMDVVLAAYELFKSNQKPSRIAIADLEGIFFLEVDKIIQLQASGINTIFYVQNEKPVIASRNIGSFAEQFEAYPNFMRTHRAHIINLKAVKKYIRGDQVVRMLDNQEAQVAKPRREALLEKLGDI